MSGVARNVGWPALIQRAAGSRFLRIESTKRSSSWEPWRATAQKERGTRPGISSHNKETFGSVLKLRTVRNSHSATWPVSNGFRLALIPMEFVISWSLCTSAPGTLVKVVKRMSVPATNGLITNWEWSRRFRLSPCSSNKTGDALS